MKNASLAIVTLFAALSTTMLSSSLYADDNTTTTTPGCNSCGCRHQIERESIQREKLDLDQDSSDLTSQ